MEVMKLKSLKYLRTDSYGNFNPTFLSALLQLKEIHLIYNDETSKLFEQKRQNGRVELKIFFFGVLLNGPDDPAMSFYYYFHKRETFVHLAENPSRLADEIPIRRMLNYAAVERVIRGLENNFVARLTDLNGLKTLFPVKDVQRFLDFLKNFGQIVHIEFLCDQPRDLFDRLSEHCAVQSLFIGCKLSDFRFLFRLEHLMRLELNFPIDVELIRNVFEKLQFLLLFIFWQMKKKICQKVTIKKGDHLKRFEVPVGDKAAKAEPRRINDLWSGWMLSVGMWRTSIITEDLIDANQADEPSYEEDDYDSPGDDLSTGQWGNSLNRSIYDLVEEVRGNGRAESVFARSTPRKVY